MGASKGRLEGPTDAEAVERARQGDHEAFRVLVERYQARVYRLAMRVLRDEDKARDAVQDAFIKVYRSLDRFEGRSSFYTWMYRLVMNLCLDMRRRDRSDREVEWNEEVAHTPGSPADAAPEQPLPGALTGADALRAEELQRQFHSLFESGAYEEAVAPAEALDSLRCRLRSL